MNNHLIDFILKKGKISLLSKGREVGSTKEAHLAIFNGKKYLLRICPDRETAKRYISMYKKFKKYNFLPKLLEFKDNYILFEFIPGRNCYERENKETIYKIGKICGIINKFKAKNDFQESRRFFQKLNALKEKKILSNNKLDEIKECYSYFDKKIKLHGALDAGDVTNDNFIVKKGKVYFVDIEAIKENIKGYGIAKAFSSWFKEKSERDYFKKGYNKFNSFKFFNEDYMRFVTLIFLINRINFKSDKGEKAIVKQSIFKLNKLLKEYKKEGK